MQQNQFQSTPNPVQFPEHEHLNCPRCDSTNTKFCYYNNYNLLQPRHFCKNCRRYWTKGGTLRKIPVGGGTRKINKRSSTSSPATTPSPPLPSPPPPAELKPEPSALFNFSNNQSVDGGSVTDQLSGAPATTMELLRRNQNGSDGGWTDLSIFTSDSDSDVSDFQTLMGIYNPNRMLQQLDNLERLEQLERDEVETESSRPKVRRRRLHRQLRG